MGTLVEDLLLLARLDQQRPLERQPVDVLALAVDAVRDARLLAPEREIRLAVDDRGSYAVTGDELRLRQVLSNLTGNALTHTPPGTPVSIELGPGRPGQPPAVLLDVTDQGPASGTGRARVRTFLPHRHLTNPPHRRPYRGNTERALRRAYPLRQPVTSSAT
ncbi:ATP-binding protein [Streptomyces sp. NPDC050421]|uniref:ATP-binding protein n=1 Tax=unclassified Streptomyces TaxID=2593676 RepID=UPI00379A309D